MPVRFGRTVWLSIALFAMSDGGAVAQEQPAAPAEESSRTAGAAATLDVGDLWRMARHKEAQDEDERKKFVVFSPSIGSKPSTGFNAGFSGNVAFFKGDPRTTHISSLSGGLKVSQKGQTLSGVRLATFTKDDRWFIQSDNRLSWTSQNTYGLGGGTASAEAENLKYDYFRFYESAYRRVQPGLFVGFGLDVSDHSGVRPGTVALSSSDEQPYEAYNQEHGFAVDKQTSSGTSMGLLFDTRDNPINAYRGILASASYRTFFEGFMGGDSTWQELYLDVRTYKKLSSDARNRLAFWLLGDFVTGGTAPYFDLPATAAQDRSARGYAEGRYRGDRLMYGELEYRGTLTNNGLVGIVLFLNTTTVDDIAAKQKLFDSFATGAGFGFRFLLNKRSRTNLCTDYGWGKDGSRGFYLAIQEAF
jgi:hypothetical protein